MPHTDTDAHRADWISVVRYCVRSQEHGLRLRARDCYFVVKSSQDKTVCVFVRYVDGPGRYDSASVLETATSVVFVSRDKELDIYTSS